jgi:hypothetical protein
MEPNMEKDRAMRAVDNPFVLNLFNMIHVFLTVSSAVFRPKKLQVRCKNCERADNQKKSYEMEPNPSKDRAMHEEHMCRSEMNSFLDSSVYIRILKYLATGLQRPLGTYRPPAEG